MKRAFSLIAGLALLAAPSFANAAANVWFELVSGDGVVLSQGAGGPLVIEKDEAPGIYTFNIAMWVNWTDDNMAANRNLTGHSTTLRAMGDTNASATAFVPNADGSFGFPQPGAPGSGNNLLSNFGNSIFLFEQGIASGAGPRRLGNFTLTINKTLDGDGDVMIQAQPGLGTWALADTTAPQVRYGNNNPVAGDSTVLGANAVIQITNIPEPATLSLLGLGAVALIRRRR